MNFELIDNSFQITILGFCTIAALFLALRYKSRSLLILALAYACFCMGTTYYILYLVIMGKVPQVFYVAEISWLAAWLFYDLDLSGVRDAADPADREDRIPLLVVCRQRGGACRSGRFCRPCLWAFLFLFRAVCTRSGSEHVSFGVWHAKCSAISKHGWSDGWLHRSAGTSVSGFRFYTGLYLL